MVEATIQPPPAPHPRRLHLTIQAAEVIGYLIQEDGRAVACLATPAEVRAWIEVRLEQLPGERDRAVSARAHGDDRLPRIINAEPDPSSWQRKWMRKS